MRWSPFVASCLIICGLISANGADEWPRWRGPQGNGTWESAPQVPELTADRLHRLWSAPVGPGYSGIAVQGGRVYTMDRPAEPTDRERVVCFDACDGRLLWAYDYAAAYKELDYGKGPRVTPTVHDGRVYTLGAVGQFVCLEAGTGKAFWSKDLRADASAQVPTWGFSASPLIVDNMVIIHAALQPNGCFAAFDRHSGAELWRSGTDPAGYCTPILVEHSGQRQLVGWTPENVVGMEPSTGKPLWQVPYKVTYGVSIATPIFCEGIVLVAGYWEGSKAIRLGKSPGEAEVVWEENRFLRGLMSQPLERDGYGYLLDKQHGMVCFELKTGTKVWTDDNRLTPRGRNPQANLVWLGKSDRALALNSEGELVLLRLSPDGYQELGRSKIIGETWAHPAFASGCVFARDDQQVVCVKLP